MDNLDDYLKQLQGQVVSSGRFTLDLRKAREKLRNFQLAEPCFYLLKIIQCVVAAEARRVDIFLGRRDVRLRAVLPAWDALRYSQKLVESLSEPQGLPPGPLRHLAIGLNAAWGIDPEWVSWTYWFSAGEGWSLRVGKQDIEVQPAGECPDRYPNLDTVEFALCRDATLHSYVRSVASEHKGIIHRCAFCPVPLYLDSRRLLGQWNPASAEGQVGNYYLAERFVCQEEGGFQICAPPWTKVGKVGQSLINRLELEAKPGARLPTFSYQVSGLKGEPSVDTLRCEKALALPMSLSGKNVLSPVKDGVTLEPLGPRLPFYSDTGLQALFAAPRVRTDLSELRAIEDDELSELLLGVTFEAERMIAELLPVCDEMPRHYPGADASGSCLAGCLGSVVAGPLGAIVGAGLTHWLVSRGDKKQRDKERSQLRKATRKRLEDLAQNGPSAGTTTPTGN